MKLNPNKMYVIVYMTGTDGEIFTSSLSGESAECFIRSRYLTKYDYAIIEGTLIKDFQ